jgi:molecular chaperone GrpE
MSKHHHEAPDQGSTVADAANSGVEIPAVGVQGPAGTPNDAPEGADKAAKNAREQAAGGGDSAQAAAEGGGGKDAGKGLSPEQRIADLEAQLADAKDQFLRKAADFENFRKRMNREKQDAIDFANQSLLLDLIPIMDDFDRAMQATDGIKDFASLYEGLGMIARRLSSTLDSKWGLKGYVSTGEVFDPNLHEALMMEKSSAVDEQIVQMDLVKGYTLKDRVIRSAKVKVLVPDPTAPAIAAPASAAAGAPTGSDATADAASCGDSAGAAATH